MGAKKSHERPLQGRYGLADLVGYDNPNNNGQDDNEELLHTYYVF